MQCARRASSSSRNPYRTEDAGGPGKSRGTVWPEGRGESSLLRRGRLRLFRDGEVIDWTLLSRFCNRGMLGGTRPVALSCVCQRDVTSGPRRRALPTRHGSACAGGQPTARISSIRQTTRPPMRIGAGSLPAASHVRTVRMPAQSITARRRASTTRGGPAGLRGQIGNRRAKGEYVSHGRLPFCFFAGIGGGQFIAERDPREPRVSSGGGG